MPEPQQTSWLRVEPWTRRRVRAAPRLSRAFAGGAPRSAWCWRQRLSSRSPRRSNRIFDHESAPGSNLAAVPLCDLLDGFVELVGHPERDPLARTAGFFSHGRSIITPHQSVKISPGYAGAIAWESHGIPLVLYGAIGPGGQLAAERDLRGMTTASLAGLRPTSFVTSSVTSLRLGPTAWTRASPPPLHWPPFSVYSSQQTIELADGGALVPQVKHVGDVPAGAPRELDRGHMVRPGPVTRGCAARARSARSAAVIASAAGFRSQLSPVHQRLLHMKRWRMSYRATSLLLRGRRPFRPRALLLGRRVSLEGAGSPVRPRDQRTGCE